MSGRANWLPLVSAPTQTVWAQLLTKLSVCDPAGVAGVDTGVAGVAVAGVDGDVVVVGLVVTVVLATCCPPRALPPAHPARLKNKQTANGRAIVL